jgi:hypothetical protein
VIEGDHAHLSARALLPGDVHRTSRILPDQDRRESWWPAVSSHKVTHAVGNLGAQRRSDRTAVDDPRTPRA